MRSAILRANHLLIHLETSKRVIPRAGAESEDISVAGRGESTDIDCMQYCHGKLGHQHN